jgi:uncharacterized LabA/DUF88 family protein
MSGISSPSYPPRAFEKAMVFVDGTNFLNRLRDGKLCCTSLLKLAQTVIQGRQMARTYFYTTAEKLEKAKEVHSATFLDGCRVVLGDSISTGNGNIKEKGVDALLVADLVYHAAQKNCSYAVVISNDSDFAYAIKRVEDFGCNTGVVAIGTQAVDRLKNACDDYRFIDQNEMRRSGWAT